MPAAAVIPAPIAYIKVVAVKKLVVGSRASDRWFARYWCALPVRSTSGLRLSALNRVL